MLDEALVAALLRQGRYEEAAKHCLEAGEPARAAELLAQIWRYDEAIRVATDAERYDEAYRHALASGRPEATAALVAALAARPEQAARAAAYAEAKGRAEQAARLREAAGDVSSAAALYERAGELAEAARCFREAGDLRRAGMLYERRLREAPDDAASAFELGQILARFGRWEHAARALQVAADDPALALPAGTLLVACFEALGLPDAAQQRLDLLRRSDPGLPASVPELLKRQFGSERGLRAVEADRLLAGRYRVLHELGAGGTGRVLAAEDAFYGRRVAIKVLHVGGAGAAGREALLRFAREAKIASSIDHPNVVRVFDYHPEGPYLVMELMPGGTLEDRLARPGEPPAPLPPTAVYRILRSVLSALEAVHRRGVVHRDLKPANVLFGAAGEVKLGDFGAAHLADLGATMTGAMLGTLAYMAPEQITGMTRPDASTDLYALGVIAYRCLTGTLPFPGPDYITQHLEAIPDPPSKHAPWIPPELDALLLRLMQKEPAQRPRSATEVLDALEHVRWEEAERDLPAAAATSLRGSSEPARAPQKGHADRWQPLQARADGTVVARDALLGRRVLVVPCDAERARMLRAFAAADGPFLQAVWSIDEEASRAILELPEGEPPKGPLGPEPIAQLRRALAALHRVGVAHGSVDAAHVTLAPGRAVLWIPARTGRDPEADLRALDALAARPR